jgi:hypothetical protein
MVLAAPDWLTRRGGEVRLNPDRHSWTVYFDRQPQYELTPVPVTGRHGCKITQTINGRLVDGTGTYATADEALRGGLEDVRKALGW